MKKRSLFFASVLSIIFSSILVSAESSTGASISKFIESVKDIVKPVSEQVLGSTPSGELLFAKILFFLIILGIIWTILDTIDFFSDKGWVVVVIAFAVSILATRWIITDGLIQTIILPYSTLGVAISAGLPLVFAFYIIEFSLQGAANKFVRYFCWVFFIVIFACLWAARVNSFLVKDSTAIYIYPLTIAACILVMLFDGTIQGILIKAKIQRMSAGYRGSGARQLQMAIKNVNDLYALDPANYMGTVSGGGLGKPNGAEAYFGDLKLLEKSLHRMLRT